MGRVEWPIVHIRKAGPLVWIVVMVPLAPKPRPCSPFDTDDRDLDVAALIAKATNSDYQSYSTNDDC
jgi:hypothetical protein